MLIELPNDILENIFYKKIEEIYNEAYNGHFKNALDCVKHLRVCYSVCKLFKKTIQKVFS